MHFTSKGLIRGKKKTWCAVYLPVDVTQLQMLKGCSAFSSNNPFAGYTTPQLSPFLHTDGLVFPVTPPRWKGLRESVGSFDKACQQLAWVGGQRDCGGVHRLGGHCGSGEQTRCQIQ